MRGPHYVCALATTSNRPFAYPTAKMASLDSLQVVAGSSPHKEAPRHLEKKKSPASGECMIKKNCASHPNVHTSNPPSSPQLSCAHGAPRPSRLSVRQPTARLGFAWACSNAHLDLSICGVGVCVTLQPPQDEGKLSIDDRTFPKQQGPKFRVTAGSNPAMGRGTRHRRSGHCTRARCRRGCSCTPSLTRCRWNSRPS